MESRSIRKGGSRRRRRRRRGRRGRRGRKGRRRGVKRGGINKK
jgi:hypothetical protein